MLILFYKEYCKQNQRFLLSMFCLHQKIRRYIANRIVTAVSSELLFFEQIQMIYTAFRKPKIRKMYEGTAVKRLIDTRWTGHFQAVRENYAQIVATLEKVIKRITLVIPNFSVQLSVYIFWIKTRPLPIFIKQRR